MSARAAARLAAIGFEQVYDYVGGKRDWLDRGLPAEGDHSKQVRSGDLARRNPPACPPDVSIAHVHDSTDLRGWDICVVVDHDMVVQGLLTSEEIAIHASNNKMVDELMLLGPTTIRPSQSIEAALERMEEIESSYLLVTTGSGELIGVLYRYDAERQIDGN